MKAHFTTALFFVVVKSNSCVVFFLIFSTFLKFYNQKRKGTNEQKIGERRSSGFKYHHKLHTITSLTSFDFTHAALAFRNISIGLHENGLFDCYLGSTNDSIEYVYILYNPSMFLMQPLSILGCFLLTFEYFYSKFNKNRLC